MNSLVEIAENLKREKKVAVICHVRPDGDALGSAVGLTLALKSLDIEVKTFCDDVIPKKFEFLDAQSFFSREINEDFSALVAVDCADSLRVGEKISLIFSKHKNTYNIDHHISNDRFAKYNYVYDNSSNSENIYELIKVLGVKITPQIANYLFMGVMTDTGNFRHKNVTPHTFLTGASLVESKADANTI
ncbi:MAG: DHH family phosphoesterase, partial [Firmicutes bacterium]|nr:DHH family phosphoesterase [Candidatus Caballimonas caccae]